MGFIVQRSTDYRRMRWKNGLGETAELAIEPAGAALDAFDWRISMARVESDGPFSLFAGVDRTLSILAGAGLRLALAGNEAVLLGPTSAPHPFAADVPCEALLEGGPVTDLNVMTRRNRYWHRVRRVVAGSITPIDNPSAAFLVASGPGPVAVCIDGADVRLAALDSVNLGPGPWEVTVAKPTMGALLLVEIGVAAGG